jgi:hypothetical protein
LERRSQHRFLAEQELKYFRAKLENLSQQSQAMLSILPEESPSPDWRRDREL